jgi:hypothetical protein
MNYSGERRIIRKLISWMGREKREGREEVNNGGANYQSGARGQTPQTPYTSIFATLSIIS